MDQDQPPKPKRRFRFSLRTLMIVVLVYAGLWALTALWGGWQLERRVEEYAGQMKRIDLAQSGLGATQYPAGGYWAAETRAYAPFLLNVRYVVNGDFDPEGARFVDSTGTEFKLDKPSKDFLRGLVHNEQDCLIFWFFGKTYKFPLGHQSIGSSNPVFGMD